MLNDVADVWITCAFLYNLKGFVYEAEKNAASAKCIGIANKGGNQLEKKSGHIS